MNKDKAVVLDIDDTLFNFVGHLLHCYNICKGQNIKDEDLTTWTLPEEVTRFFLDNEFELYTSQPVFPLVRNAINRLKEANYKIILMTARDIKFLKQTEFSLKINSVHYDLLLFNKNKALKINRLSEAYDIVAFADDKLSTIEKVKKETKVPNVYLISMPSNRNAELGEGIKRINSIIEIVKDIL